MRKEDEFMPECRGPSEVANVLTKDVCVHKTNLKIWQLLLLGILAGAYVGFGASFATLVSSDAIKYLGAGIGRMLMGAAFSVGIMLVVIAGAELFTGDNLMVMSALDNKVSLVNVLWKLVVIYFANFIGAMLLALIIFNTNIWKSYGHLFGIQALDIANIKVNLTWLESFARGIACNWLVCLAIWMAAASRNVIGKIFAIFFPIMTFVALGFEHSIANMYYISIGILIKNTEAAQFYDKSLSNLNVNGFINNLIPVTLGNLLSGTIFVGFIYWLVYVRCGNENK